MVQAKNPDSTTAPAAQPKRPKAKNINPANLPARYALQCDGSCMEPVIPDGTVVQFSSAQAWGAGDIVNIWLRPETVPPGEHQVIVKRVVTGRSDWPQLPYKHHPGSDIAPPSLVVEMLNPRRLFAIPYEAILAVHKFIGTQPPAAKPLSATRFELSAVFLDPLVADAFARAERAPGSTLTVPTPWSEPLAGRAAVRPSYEQLAQKGPVEARRVGGAFDQNLRRLSAAANLAYALAINPMPIPALLNGACAGADPQLGRDLLDVVDDGLEIGQAVLELLAAVRRSLEEATR
jgi:hypothetical protein